MKLGRWLAGLLVLACAHTLTADEPDKGVEFFEARVRPLLANNCFSCHGPAKQSAGLRLDSRVALLKGTGKPVVVPGDPEASKLIQAVRQQGELSMPPQRKLADDEIAVLVAWVKLGAPWPETPTAARGAKETTAPEVLGRDHWAFRPVVAPPVPNLPDPSRVVNDIDRFIQVRLHVKGLAPSKTADRRTLIRRVTFDLIGLPPTPAEVEAFVNDPAPDAYERLVDRLLASPRYGERWARHWLDVARYADTKGYVFDTEPRYPFAYTYRDWVVRALNEDLPYDQFLTQQIAADQLPPGEDKRPLAALGFLTLGRWLLASEQDQIDDRLDVLFRGTMGVSISCARCHDHKYDPIPTADYYSLYGLFVGGQKSELPIPATAEEQKGYDDYFAELAARDQAVAAFLAGQRLKLIDPARPRAGDYLLAGQQGLNGTPQPADSPLLPYFVQRWQNRLAATKDAPHPVYAAWHAFAALTPEQFEAEAKPLAERLAANADAAAPLNPLVARLFAGEPPRDLAEVARRYGELFVRVEKLWQRELTEAAEEGLPQPPAFAQPAREELRLELYGDAAPADAPEAELRSALLAEAEQKALAELDKKAAEWREQSPPLANVLIDGPDPGDPFVFVRGNAGTPGDQVPRRFLGLASAAERTPIPHAGGRLELAKAIVSPDNPLTARVLVNRVWAHHFGTGLAATPSDFGTRGETPSHPELLDHLAARFVADGWSLKQLHRSILLSHTYRQVSDDDAERFAVDPDNRLLWRMNRRALEVEPLRDSLLAVTDGLDATLGGRPVNIAAEPDSRRRTLYSLVDRLDLPSELRTFDFADPDGHQPKRHSTIVPQQALYLLNGPFLAEQARRLGARVERDGPAETKERIAWMYRELFGREAAADEVELGLRFLDKAEAMGAQGPPRRVNRWQYGWGSLDAKKGRLKSFTPLAHFTGDTWQGGAEMPDPKSDWALLNADGGHPGGGLDRVVVRRWVAPAAGKVAVSGTLTHDPGEATSDGIRAWIIAGQKGRVKTWVLGGETKSADTKVKQLAVAAGETVDFVVDSKGTVDNDGFGWVVAVEWLGDAPPGGERRWGSQADFGGPTPEPRPLSAWAKYAQVLLMSNEFVFID